MKKYTELKLGWVRDLPDWRDRMLQLPKPKRIPDIMDVTAKFPPIYDQETTGGCVGNSVAAEFDYIRKKQGLPFMSPSRLFIYYNARAIEGSVASDSGTSIRSAIKAAVNIGVCPESAWPNVEEQVTVKPSKAAYKLAPKNKIVQYTRLVSDLSISIYALTQGVPFIFGFSVFESFYSAAVTKTGFVPMPKEGEGLLGGHSCVCVGFNNLTKRFLCRNSWGTSWANKGQFTLPYEYLENRGLSDDFWAIQKVSPAK